MARRGMRGQLNMFDFVNSLNLKTTGEVEMVALMPDYEEQELDEIWDVELLVEEEIPEEPEIPVEEEIPEEPEILVEEEIPEEQEIPVVEDIPTQKEFQDKETPKTEERPSLNRERVAMSRKYKVDGKEVEVAYINYNIVRITKEGELPIIKRFESTKEAVDFYIEQIQEDDIDGQ